MFFLDYLFENIGETIKRTAKFILVFDAIVFILAGGIGMIVSFAFMVDGDPFGALWLFLSPICAIAGILSCIFPLQLLYGFGQLITNTDKDVEAEYAPTLKKLSSISSGPSIVTSGKTWVCPKCGTSNHTSLSTCSSCGTKYRIMEKKIYDTTPIVNTNTPSEAAWNCPECGKANHPSRTTCRHCGAAK